MAKINQNTIDLQDILAQVKALPNAGGGNGEDVTAETNAYTEKIASLELAVNALETELAGKAGGGNNISWNVTLLGSSSEGNSYVYYTDSNSTYQELTVGQNETRNIKVLDSTLLLTGDGTEYVAGLTYDGHFVAYVVNSDLTIQLWRGN